MNTFSCGRCRAPLHASVLYVQRNWPVHCRKCGATHHASGSVISPEMLPVNARSNCGYSPWQFSYTRPVNPGDYQVEFRDIEETLTLWWNGRYFQPNEQDVRPVQMASMLKWRGVWASA